MECRIYLHNGRFLKIKLKVGKLAIYKQKWNVLVIRLSNLKLKYHKSHFLKVCSVANQKSRSINIIKICLIIKTYCKTTNSPILYENQSIIKNYL